MAVKIDRFRIINRERGNTTILASFTADIGIMEFNGVEIVESAKGTFIAFPNRRYNAGTEKRPDWKTFNYIWFKGSKGEALKREIEQAAFEELERRGGESQGSGGSGGYGGRGGHGGYGGGRSYSGKSSYRSRAAYDDNEDSPF